MKYYSPRAKTVEIFDIGKYAGMVPLGFGIPAAELRKDYDITLIGEESVGALPTTHIALTPKSAETRRNFVKIELWIWDQRDLAYPIQEKLTTPSKDYHLVTYSEPSVNLFLPDSAYTLKLPPGAKEEIVR